MRSLVLLVMLLAAGKVGYQDWVYRRALSETLVMTYRSDAVRACQREATRVQLTVSYVSWTEPAAIEVSVGRLADRAGLIGRDLFDENARRPYVVITAREKPFRIVCEYDVSTQVASVFRM
ncbi:MAG: hypothetical protein R3D33_00355 [Hyphomicrobiaceae bacterium]